MQQGSSNSTEGNRGNMSHSQGSLIAVHQRKSSLLVVVQGHNHLFQLRSLHTKHTSLSSYRSGQPIAHDTVSLLAKYPVFVEISSKKAGTEAELLVKMEEGQQGQKIQQNIW